eukprot:gene9815-8739_t
MADEAELRAFDERIQHLQHEVQKWEGKRHGHQAAHRHKFAKHMPKTNVSRGDAAAALPPGEVNDLVERLYGDASSRRQKLEDRVAALPDAASPTYISKDELDNNVERMYTMEACTVDPLGMPIHWMAICQRLA